MTCDDGNEDVDDDNDDADVRRRSLTKAIISIATGCGQQICLGLQLRLCWLLILGAFCKIAMLFQMVALSCQTIIAVTYCLSRDGVRFRDC